MPVPPFQRALDEHAAVVLRVLVAQLGREEAEDAFQETFLAALRAWPRLRAGSDVRSWLLTIAHRKAIDVHRQRRRRPVPVEQVAERRADDAAEAPDDHWPLVRRLPPRQRAVLTLRYAADLEHRQIAGILGCSEEAARRAAADGLKRLREELRDAPAAA